MSPTCPLLALCGLLSAPTPAAPVEPAPASYRLGFDSVTDAQLRAWLEFLASNELSGRESGTQGYDVAARYVASVLQGLGIASLGEANTYFQPFDLVRRERDGENAVLSLSVGDREEKFTLKDQFAVAEEGPVPSGDINWDGPWVFVGDGGASTRDAPDVFHGVDLQRSVVLVLPRAGVREPEDRGARWAGARRVVVISDERVKSRVGLSFSERAEGAIAAAPDAAPPTVFISRALADRVLERKGTSVEKLLSAPARAQMSALDGLEIKLKLPMKESRRATRNVVGFLEGTDPKLKQEVVAIGAHLDHVGMVGGKIHPGADDDGSGVSAVLGAASAFQANGRRPLRSLLFLFFAAEEKGLFGSRWFAEHPPMPLDRFVLELQLDMVGRNEESAAHDKQPAEKAEDNTDTIHVVGSKRHALELDPWVHTVNAHTALKLEYDEERVYERSDQYSFGSRGVPVVFFFAGFHGDYHQPSDTVDKINFDKLLRVTRLVFSTAFEVADRPQRLRVDRI